jgi:hypothetical protein
VVRGSRCGAGEVTLVLIIKEVPEDEREELIRAGGAAALADPEFITLAGGTLVDAGTTKLGGEDAPWNTYLITQAEGDAAATVMVWSLHALHEGKYANVQFQITNTAGAKADLPSDDWMKMRLSYYRPLLEKIVESAALGSAGK